MEAEAGRPRLWWWRWATLGVTTAVVLVVGWVGVSTWAWGSGLDADDRLLPGATIAGTDVGEMAVDEATGAVQVAIDERLDRTVTVTHADDAWDVTPRDLDGTADVRGAVEDALAATSSASFLDLVRLRWLGDTSDLELPVHLEIADDAITAFVADVADGIDHDPVDAQVTRTDDGRQLELVADETGERVDRDDAATQLRAAFDQDRSQVTLPVEPRTASVTSEVMLSVLPDVQSAMDSALDRTVTLDHGDDVWEVSPRDLDSDADIDAALGTALAAVGVDAALEGVAADGVGDAQVRPASSGLGDVELEVPVDVPPEKVAGFVDDVAEEIDREPSDARIEREGGSIEVVGGTVGARLDRDAATTSLLAALEGGDTAVSLPVETRTPALTADTASGVVDDIQAAIDAALDRQVTVVHEDERWTTSPRELSATSDASAFIDATVEALRADPGASTDDVGASVSVTAAASELESFVASIAGEVDVPAEDGDLTVTGDGIDITPGVPGLAVDQGETRSRIASAFNGGATEVTVATSAIQPEQGTSGDGHVLVLRQGDRELDLYLDGEVARTWPVAVGTGGSPTPTGTFTVGAKRFEPTWVNPAPDRWGADMPDRVEPGPDNPLGARALNWNRPGGGGDTLIRFHGTPNEDSIGQAASNGCVRMFNEDVIELYDLVPSGTTIISLP